MHATISSPPLRALSSLCSYIRSPKLAIVLCPNYDTKDRYNFFPLIQRNEKRATRYSYNDMYTDNNQRFSRAGANLFLHTYI